MRKLLYSVSVVPQSSVNLQVDEQDWQKVTDAHCYLNDN